MKSQEVKYMKAAFLFSVSFTDCTKKTRHVICKYLQRRATERAKLKVRLNKPVTERTAQSLRRNNRSRMVCVWKRKRARINNITLVTIQSGFFSRPSPHWNKEELQNLVVLNQISLRSTPYTSAYSCLQHLTHLLLYSSHQKEEHGCAFSAFSSVVSVF